MISSLLLDLPVDFFFFSSRRRHTRLQGDWSSDVCSSDLFRPLIPHAQGTKEVAVGFICSIAEGTKIPRQAPIGSTKEKTIAARSQKDRPMRPGRCGKMKPYSASITAATT